MILIGSKAIRFWYPDFKREPKDTDYAVAAVPSVKQPNTEYLVNDVLFYRYNHNCSILPAHALYTLKISHLFWNLNWDKHMFDVQFLKSKGCKLDLPLFYELYAFFNKMHGNNKRSDLKMSAADFFDNAVKCEHDHDYLHTILNSVPTYTKILKDGAEVEVDEEKFNALAIEDKFKLVQEEVMVMAWERYSDHDYRSAYTFMLKKFIINHAPMWEALFIIDNYVELMRPPFNYYKKISNELHHQSVK